jgi:hypothetical protein
VGPAVKLPVELKVPENTPLVAVIEEAPKLMPVADKVPATTVSPVEALTVNLLEPTTKLPVEVNAVETVIKPFVTVNLDHSTVAALFVNWISAAAFVESAAALKAKPLANTVVPCNPVEKDPIPLTDRVPLTDVFPADTVPENTPLVADKAAIVDWPVTPKVPENVPLVADRAPMVV